ncbi:MAG: pirin family protein [Holophagaceae bacterium]|nr:pirin family protein [Holophagaceae bacterium]
MLTLRRSEDRGHFDFGWLDTRHTFSFGEYFDPAHHQFHALRVINEDRVAPGAGFGTHGHKDMEILTWVLEGALEHQDSLGTKGIIRPGEAQVMSAGTGIRHSEYNASKTEPVHFMQIWMLPEAKDLKPRYDQVAFPDDRFRNTWGLIASRDEAEGSVVVFQDLKVHVSRLDAGTQLVRDLDPGRAGWLHVAKGSVLANGQTLKAGDALALESESKLVVEADDSSEVLFFDLE